MAWIVKLEEKVKKQISKFDKNAQKQIQALVKKIENCINPREFGKALSGNLSGFWRYRTGDYRVICKIYDSSMIVLLLMANHRKKVYKINKNNLIAYYA